MSELRAQEDDQLEGPASGAPDAARLSASESTGTISEEEAWVRIAAENAQDANVRYAELMLTLRHIHRTARRALSFGRQATPQTLERMIERRDEFLMHIVGMCEEAGVESPSVLREVCAQGRATP